MDDPGKGVDIYIFDSGIKHPIGDEFQDSALNDRVKDVINFSDNTESYGDDAPNGGHGTLVASAVGSKSYGIAKAATLNNVKYELDGKPNNFRFTHALRRVISLHQSRKDQPGFKGSIINMSETMARSSLAAATLAEAAKEGISLVAGAGNYKYKPKTFPATEPDVISVAASNRDYTPWSEVGGQGSNYGQDVIDLWAPGNKVPLCNKNGNQQFGIGTSYSAPYVTGILALFYGLEGKAMTPALAKTRLMAQTDG